MPTQLSAKKSDSNSTIKKKKTVNDSQTCEVSHLLLSEAPAVLLCGWILLAVITGSSDLPVSQSEEAPKHFPWG